MLQPCGKGTMKGPKVLFSLKDQIYVVGISPLMCVSDLELGQASQDYRSLYDLKHVLDI